MAKKINTETENNAIDELNDSLTGLGRKVQDNQSIIFIVTAVIAVIVIAVLIYLYAFRIPGQKAADDAIGNADIELAVGNDSIALNQYMSIADNKGYDAGNRAALQAAILLYDKGEYEQALKYLKKHTPKESFIGAAAYSLEGDCYVNTDRLDDAIKAYKHAIAQSDDNPAYTPFFMLKLARVYREKQDYKAEAEVYEQIQKDYPLYGATYNVDIEKYLDRAQIQAGK